MPYLVFSAGQVELIEAPETAEKRLQAGQEVFVIEARRATRSELSNQATALRARDSITKLCIMARETATNDDVMDSCKSEVRDKIRDFHQYLVKLLEEYER